MNSFLLIFLASKVIELVQRSDPNINFQTSFVDTDSEIGTLNLDEEGILIFM